MKISELIAALEKCKDQKGDVEVELVWFGEGVSTDDIHIVYAPKENIIWLTEPKALKDKRGWEDLFGGDE